MQENSSRGRLRGGWKRIEKEGAEQPNERFDECMN